MQEQNWTINLELPPGTKLYGPMHDTCVTFEFPDVDSAIIFFETLKQAEIDYEKGQE